MSAKRRSTRRSSESGFRRFTRPDHPTSGSGRPLIPRARPARAPGTNRTAKRKRNDDDETKSGRDHGRGHAGNGHEPLRRDGAGRAGHEDDHRDTRWHHHAGQRRNPAGRPELLRRGARCGNRRQGLQPSGFHPRLSGLSRRRENRVHGCDAARTSGIRARQHDRVAVRRSDGQHGAVPDAQHHQRLSDRLARPRR